MASAKLITQFRSNALVPRSSAKRTRRLLETTRALIRVARVGHRYGAARAQIWLKRVHGLRSTPARFRHVFREDRCAQTDEDAQAPTQPDDPVREGRTGRLRAGRRQGREAPTGEGLSRHRDRRLHAIPGASSVSPPASAHEFLDEVRRDLPFPSRKLQCNNGSEFPFAFQLAVEAAGVRHRYIKPRRPQQNGQSNAVTGSTTRSSWSHHAFATRAEADGPLADWARRDNHETTMSGARWRSTAAHQPRSCWPNKPLSTPASSERARTLHPRRVRAQRTAKAAAGFGAQP